MGKVGPDHAEPTGREFGFILNVIGGLELVGLWGATIIFSL